jgi:hypothetical protein
MWWVDVVGPVAGHIAPAGRVLERPVEQGVDVADGLGGEALAVAAAVGKELAVEGGDAGRGEPLQLQAAQGRDDVDLQVGLGSWRGLRGVAVPRPLAATARAGRPRRSAWMARRMRRCGSGRVRR